MIVRGRNPDRIGPEIIGLVTERLRNSEGLKTELPGVVDCILIARFPFSVFIDGEWSRDLRLKN